jgi:molybdate transport system substrate-binding protein
MTNSDLTKTITILAICGLFLLILTAGCTDISTTASGSQDIHPATPVAGTPEPVIAFTAASLTGSSSSLGPAFEKSYPEYDVKFDLDGTQMLRQKIENGADADIFISASNKYTEALKSEGYLRNDTVKKFAANYIIVILPVGNPGNIHSLEDLARDGVSIAMGTPEVPVGINTRVALDKLANSTYGDQWKSDIFKNVKTYETAEPGIVTKVSLGEVDAGFVYESSYKAAMPGTLSSIDIPEEDNALQIYTIGILTAAMDPEGAEKFIEFITSPEGQNIMAGYGFRQA